MMSKLRVLIGVFAIAAVRLVGIGSAYADGPGGTIPNTFFTQLPGVAPTTPVRYAPAPAVRTDGQATVAYVAQSHRGTWLFAPHDGGGANDQFNSRTEIDGEACTARASFVQ